MPRGGGRGRTRGGGRGGVGGAAQEAGVEELDFAEGSGRRQARFRGVWRAGRSDDLHGTAKRTDGERASEYTAQPVRPSPQPPPSRPAAPPPATPAGRSSEALQWSADTCTGTFN